MSLPEEAEGAVPADSAVDVGVVWTTAVTEGEVEASDAREDAALDSWLEYTDAKDCETAVSVAVATMLKS